MTMGCFLPAYIHTSWAALFLGLLLGGVHGHRHFSLCVMYSSLSLSLRIPGCAFPGSKSYPGMDMMLHIFRPVQQEFSPAKLALDPSELGLVQEKLVGDGKMNPLLSW